MFQKYGLVPDGLETLYGKTGKCGRARARGLGGLAARTSAKGGQSNTRPHACVHTGGTETYWQDLQTPRCD